MSYDEAIALSDTELALATFAAVASLTEALATEIDSVQDELYFLLVETFERFAPNAARAELEALFADDDPRELAAAIDGMREREATRLLRDAVGAIDDV
jgi:hypothetical protein